MLELDQKKVTGSVIRLHPGDNTVVAREIIERGAMIDGLGIEARDKIPAGNKIASQPIAKGEPVRKYNVVVGFAADDIAPGTWLHNHNTEFREFDRDPAHASEYQPVDMLPEAERATFQGIVRDDGRVATRNYIGICSTVNCSATVVRKAAEYFTPERLAAYPNVDGVVAFSHGLGCGMEMSGEPMDLLRRTIAGFACHPNVAATLIVGLGCERNQIAGLMQAHGLESGPKLHTFTMQATGGTRKTIAAVIEAIEAMLPEADKVTRQPVPASHITVGLQCGGSDGFSSITANPALGHAIDILVRHGGTGILSETPEIYGVEHTLTRRACSVEVGEKLLERIRWWKDDYAVGRDVQINGTVSPGNQMGGLANIIEKYAEPVRTKGFVFMDTPGYDPVSATGQIAGGANLVAFTTGRGSMFGSKPAPCIKLATNTEMFRYLEEDMDINCGEIVDGTKTMEEMGQAIFQLFLDTASGKKTKSELLGLGDNEFVPWDIGITG